MSFSSEVKEELLRQVSAARHCQIAELTALLLMSGSVWYPNIHLRTENFRVAKKVNLLIYRIFHVSSEVRIRIHSDKKAAVVYEVAVNDRKAVEQIRQTCKLSGFGGLNHLIIQKECCKRAFLRGAFLVSGSVNNPEKSYHFEIACEERGLAETLQELFHVYELDAKIVRRKKYDVVYLKEAAMIVDALNIMGAYRALMNMENVRVWKEVRNQTNRKVNCDLANINKTLTAAQRQLEDIRYIERVKGFSGLSAGLRQVAELRLQEPELSLKELGEQMQPPVSKSGVNHRLHKLSEIAENLKQNNRQEIQ